MTSQEATAVLETIYRQCADICEIAKTAARHRKSLSGQGPYGMRFHDAVIALSKTSATLKPVPALAGLDDDASGRFSSLFDVIRSPKAQPRERIDAVKQMKMTCETVVLPAVGKLSANPVPETEQVLPLDLVRPTRRKYIERVAVQANGCYERQWCDACSVMMRRLVETLIIEMYKAKGIENGIKNHAGDFMMLGGLIDAVLADQSSNLGRDVKKTLPEIKTLGDWSAHARRYTATKQDLDKVLPGFRRIVEEFLHLAGLL